MPKMLSKSRYLNGLQCPRLLWIATNETERIPEPDASTQHIFDQGHLVGELAKKLYPGGIDLPTEDFMSNLNMAKELLRQRRPLFEAGVLSGRIYSRVDILNPVNDNEWDIIEVKSSTSVKDVNIHDVSFQKLCWENSGVKIRRCFLACINNQYVKHGEIIPEQLFAIHDITEEVSAASIELEAKIAEMLEIIDSTVCPEIGIGPHCSDPYDCLMQAECWDGLPEHNVFTLYYGGKKSHELYTSGILTISDIPAGFKLNDKQRIQCSCVASGQPYIDKESIRGFLDSLEYPLYYLDFETFSTAVPIFDGTRPYQNIPFQYSLHVKATPSADVTHVEFLAGDTRDPRLELLESLSKAIGTNGQVVAYNKSFEARVLDDLGEAFPEYAAWTAESTSRLVDLIVPFRSFSYYHPSQQGSASLKKVLPAITDLSYDQLPIAKGDDASLAFLSITFGDVAVDDVARVRKELLTYCKMDTEGMVWIVGRLKELITI
ncbi:DUF2779 domain-containing protein [Chloroflexota bacterium]